MMQQDERTVKDGALVTLADVVGWIESRGRPYVMRTEPLVLSPGRKYRSEIMSRIVIANSCDEFTSRVIYSTSFGAYQIMGFNLYAKEFGYTNSVATFLNSESDQLSVFMQFVVDADINYTPQELCNRSNAQDFARTYNGSLKYVDAINESLTHFGIKR